MLYHATQVKGIAVLEPRVSNHDRPLIYFSKKRENVLVYLSNAVEKYCRETGFSHAGKWTKWGPYGFTKDGILYIQEYYPNALEDTYKGVSGYIYGAEKVADSGFELQIRDAVTTDKPTPVTYCEYVADAYEEILKAEREEKIQLLRYEKPSPERLEWMERMIRDEYGKAADQPEYRHFLKGKFPEICG